MNKVRIFNIKYENEFRKKFHEGVDQILDEAFLSNYTFVEKFESKFKEFNQSKYALATSNGTTALESALRVCNVKDKFVLVSTNTFVATAVAIVNAGGTPLPIDIENKFYALNPYLVESKIKEIGSDNIAAVVAVHIGGHVAPTLMRLKDICEYHKIDLIEDCAQAHGAKLNGLQCGNFGRFGCFSMFTTKIMATGEGGMVVCNNLEDYQQLRSVRSFGMDLENSLMHYRDGGNYKLGEFQALMGVLELDRIEDRIKKRREIAKLYQTNLNPKKYYTFSDWENTYSTYYKQIVLPLTKSRNQIEDVLNRNGVPLTGGVYYFPVHQQKKFSKDCNVENFPIANDYSLKHFCPPCYPELDKEEIESICKVLNNI